MKLRKTHQIDGYVNIVDLLFLLLLRVLAGRLRWHARLYFRVEWLRWALRCEWRFVRRLADWRLLACLAQVTASIGWLISGLVEIRNSTVLASLVLFARLSLELSNYALKSVAGGNGNSQIGTCKYYLILNSITLSVYPLSTFRGNFSFCSSLVEESLFRMSGGSRSYFDSFLALVLLKSSCFTVLLPGDPAIWLSYREHLARQPTKLDFFCDEACGNVTLHVSLSGQSIAIKVLLLLISNANARVMGFVCERNECLLVVYANACNWWAKVLL